MAVDRSTLCGVRIAGLPLHAAAVGAALLLAACGDAPDTARAPRPVGAASAQPRPVPSGEALAARLGCGSCHAGVPIEGAAGALPVEDPTLDPAAVYEYLLNVPRPAEGTARMPDFQLAETEAAALALTIAAGRPGSGGGDADALRAVVGARDLVTDTLVGSRVRTALQCDACHDGRSVPAAPPLPFGAAAVRPEWLREFLKRPHAVRPVGWRPGTATRMPDFRLTDTEADSLVAWLTPTGEPPEPPATAPLSPRQRENTLTLMRDRWSCMGCHAWNGEGGRIGPDLAMAAERLWPAHVRAMLEDPAAAAPGTIMPRPLLEPADIERIVALLTHNEDARDVWREPMTVLNPRVYVPATGDDAAAVYDRSCAVCHGRTGIGTGINATFLEARPTNHADSIAMSERPDDTLYDGIAAGGRILGRSEAMPAFGGSLEPETIHALVAHIRTLCRCEGPAWSRDDGVAR